MSKGASKNPGSSEGGGISALPGNIDELPEIPDDFGMFVSIAHYLMYRLLRGFAIETSHCTNTSVSDPPPLPLKYYCSEHIHALLVSHMGDDEYQEVLKLPAPTPIKSPPHKTRG